MRLLTAGSLVRVQHGLAKHKRLEHHPLSTPPDKGSHNPNTLNEHKLPGGGVDFGEVKRTLNEQLKGEFGIDMQYVKDIIGEGIYLDHKAIADAKLCLCKVTDAAVRLLKTDTRFQFVTAYDKAGTSAIPQWIRERIINGYYQGRSGDIIAMTKVNYFDWGVGPDFYGSSHGT